MTNVVPAASRMAVGVVAAVLLSLGAGGIAGAASPAPAPGSPTTSPTDPSPAPPSTTAPARRHFDCDRAPRALARIQKVERDIKSGLPKLNQAEQRAKSAGKTTRAQRIQRRIERLENPRTTARLDRLTQRIEARCGAPASGSAAGSTPTSA